MRLIKMIGGLGNQMFIYAFYLQMRKRFPGTRIDLSDMRHYHAHNGYELDRVFGISDREFCIAKPLKKVLEFLFFKVILERKQNLETMEAFTKSYAYPFLYFKGFYQSERFFKDVEGEVRQAFAFDLNKANAESQTLARQIQENPHAVSLHVRRGDYMEPKFYKRYGTVCSQAYFQRAVEMMLAQVPQAHFYIFSDDVEWVQQNLRLPRATVVSCNRGADSWQDMMLMSLCRHNIICNSTFSWWGAWLNANPEKRVIAPSRWLADVDMPYIIPETWIKV
ncbi:MAG: alpha-1,2-fucosyltransferase [Bacteroidaceae bacterium]|nr:alpha-1,2-fucosyltransferase [Bacteroidaceae bacterium]